MGSFPKHRVRDQSKKLDSDLTFTHTKHEPLPLTVQVPVNGASQKVDHFQDIIGNKQSWQNAAYHFRAVGSVQPLHDLRDLEGEVVLECDNRPFFDVDLLMSSIPVPSPQDLADFGLYARQRAISAVDAGPMILAFLGELIESIGKIIAKLILGKGIAAKIAARFESEFRRLVAKAGGTIKGDWKEQLSQWPSQAWLAWNFAIKPFVGDLVKLFTSLNYATKRLEWLKRRNCKPTFIRTRRKFELTDCPYVGPVTKTYVPVVDLGSSVMAFGVGLKYECTSIEWTCSSQNCVRFNIPSSLLEGPGALPYVWANYVGITNPIKSIWELVPWSWLIEWFLGYKTILQKELTNFTALADAEHLGAVSSMKAKAFITCTQVDLHGGEIPLGEVKVEWYTRFGSEFDSDLAPAFKWPFGAYQFSILGALVLQWWQKRR